MPWVREVNVVRVETTTRSVTAAELAHAARERFPALPAVEITIEEDQIVIRRAGGGEGEGEEND